MRAALGCDFGIDHFRSESPIISVRNGRSPSSEIYGHLQAESPVTSAESYGHVIRNTKWRSRGGIYGSRCVLLRRHGEHLSITRMKDVYEGKRFKDAVAVSTGTQARRKSRASF